MNHVKYHWGQKWYSGIWGTSNPHSAFYILRNISYRTEFILYCINSYATNILSWNMKIHCSNLRNHVILCLHRMKRLVCLHNATNLYFYHISAINRSLLNIYTHVFSTFTLNKTDSKAVSKIMLSNTLSVELCCDIYH